MPIDIRMPEFSAELTSADLIDWLVKPGDEVAEGDLIAEFETDKATVEFESPASGVVLELVVDAGTQGITVGTLLARLEGEATAADASDGGADPSAAPPPAEAPAPAPAQSAPAPAAVAAAATPALPEADVSAQPAPRASALAKRVATQEGIGLDSIEGSGIGGRIVVADVQAQIAPATSTSAQPASATELPAGAVAHSSMRRTIARRLSEAKRDIPHFYLDIDCRIDKLLATRKRINAEGSVKISVNDFVIAAAARAMRDVPEMNVSWTDDAMIHHDSIDIAVAVATDGGLVTPIVRSADRLGLASVSAAMRDLAGRARDRKLKPAEYQGGCFSISNLGMYGINSVYAIVNPPHAGILGVGAGQQQPVVIDGELAVGTVMRCTLSADHRAVDGAVGAEWLAAFQRLIEDPLELLL